VHQNAYHAGTGLPGSPADVSHGAHNTDVVKRRADDQRRLRRVKDSREQLKTRTRARAASSGTIDTTTSGSTAGRSYTVANVHHGVLYLRYADDVSLVFWHDVTPHTSDGRSTRCTFSTRTWPRDGDIPTTGIEPVVHCC
jgi:hypothetical protein